MKHIKTYENTNWKGDRDEVLSYVALYLEEQQPVKSEDGFIECVYDSDELFCFSFYIGTDDKYFDDFYNFLKNNKLKIYREIPYGKDKWEIQVKLSEKKIKEFAEIYNNSKKYNL